MARPLKGSFGRDGDPAGADRGAAFSVSCRLVIFSDVRICPVEQFLVLMEFVLQQRLPYGFPLAVAVICGYFCVRAFEAGGSRPF